jgi:predicted nucleotidyltransferase
VFGSFARGEAGPGSDLDLLIEAGPARTPFVPGGLVADLEEEPGMRIDVATRASLSIVAA